jgi:hypothetical protein
MKFALAAITLLAIGWYLGTGACDIWEYFVYELVWVNPVGRASSEAVLDFEDARLTDFYFAIRTDFRFGIPFGLLGFLCALILPRKLDSLPWFLVVGVVVQSCVPAAIAIFLRVPEELVPHIPEFFWDIASIPACMLGTALGRLVKRRRVPRWRIRSVGIMTALLALWLAVGLQSPTLLFPFATCGILALLSIWLLIQTNVTVGQSPNDAVSPSVGSGPS